MPNSMLKNISEERDIPLGKVEEYWKKAKEIAKKKFDPDSSDFFRYTTGIVKKMTGYVAKSSSTPPKRVQHDIRRQLHTVLKPLFTRIVQGLSLPKGMACHAQAFVYLMENDDPKLRQVMLYRRNTVNEEASMLAHSVVCKGAIIVFDSRQSGIKEIVDGAYFDTHSNSVLYVGASLTLDQIQFLISV